MMFPTYRMSLLLGLQLVALFSAGTLSHAESDQRPNVVFAFADDWGRYASAYAAVEPGGISDAVQTPHFDKIAKGGVLFTHAFVSAPSCTPCRSSLLSGQHFWRCGLGAILLGAKWDLAIPSYPLLLEEQGYRIGHTYKVWSPGTPADAPHGGAARGFNAHGRKFNQFSQYVSQRPNIEQAKQELLDEVRLNIRSFISAQGDAVANNKLDRKPFCYFFGPTNCHRKWIAGSGKALWGIDPESLKGKLPAYLPDETLVREDMADYLGEVQAFDAALGVLVDELERVGELDNTILVVSGDHGVPGVTRGKCNLYDFGTHVPLAIHWPEGITSPGRVVDDFVSLPDLAPTFLEVANVTPPSSMTARSLVPVLKSDASGLVDPARDAVFTGRERHVATVREGNLPYPQRAIRTREYLYIINFAPDRWPMGEGFNSDAGDDVPSLEQLREDTFAAFGDMDASPTKAWLVLNREQHPEAFEYAFGLRPRLELYDVASDPDCMKNLAGQAKYQAIETKLHERLMGELKSTGDPRVSDDVVFERSPFTDASGPNPPKKKGKGAQR